VEAITRGHLGIIMTPVEYVVISAMIWAEPHNPDPIPLVAHGNDPVDDAHLSRLHDEFRRIHTNRVKVDQALNCIVLEAFHNIYNSQLVDYLLHY
jgi:hypothetical protein